MSSGASASLRPSPPLRPSVLRLIYSLRLRERQNAEKGKTDRKEGGKDEDEIGDRFACLSLPTVLRKNPFPNPPNSRNNVSLIDVLWLHHTIHCTCARNSRSAEKGEFVVGGNSFRDSTTRQTQLKRRSTSVSKFAFTLSEMTRYALLSISRRCAKAPTQTEREGLEGFYNFSRRSAKQSMLFL